MSELREWTASEIEEYDDARLELAEDGKIDCTRVYIKSEADKVITRLKAREDVLVTDNRNLLEKVKMLEERLRENAEHFKLNESQIIANADKVIADLKKACNDKDDWCLHTLKELRHNKYKRCLNNAWWCRKLSNTYTLSAYTHRGWKIARYYDEKAELYRKWHKRWLSIAEKFKEDK